MTQIVVLVILTVVLFVGKVGLKGYYLAIEDLKKAIENGVSEYEELLPKKEELFSVMFWTYLGVFVLYCILTFDLIYDMVAPISQ